MMSPLPRRVMLIEINVALMGPPSPGWNPEVRSIPSVPRRVGPKIVVAHSFPAVGRFLELDLVGAGASLGW